MAKRVDGFVVQNREMKDKWEQLLSLQQETAELAKDAEESVIAEAAEGEVCAGGAGPESEKLAPPEASPAETEPDPHADVGEPVPILKLIRNE